MLVLIMVYQRRWAHAHTAVAGAGVEGKHSVVVNEAGDRTPLVGGARC